MQNELGDAKQQQRFIETDLMRAKMQNDAMAHEISLLKSQLATSHEAIEARCKSQILAERNQHRAEIASLKERFANSSKSGQSTESQLLNALATIDSLKGEKAALMVALESQRGGNDHPFLTNLQIEPGQKKRSLVPLSSLIPVSAGFPHHLAVRIDANLRIVFGFFGARPVARLVLLIWIIIVHVLWLF
jgi:hypothetical protein